VTRPPRADTTATDSADDARRLLVYQLTRIRGACVLGVILIHLTAPFPARVPFDWLTGLMLYLNSLARFAVPIFVLVSGFYLSLNGRNERAGPFYRRTLKALVIPYVVYSAGYAMISHRDAAGWLQAWLWATLTGTAFYHLWFIPVILELYLLHPILRRWYRRSPLGGRFVLLAVAAQVTWAVATDVAIKPPAADSWLSLPAVGLSFLSYVGYFVMGYFLHDCASQVVNAARRPAVIVASGLAWAATAAMIAAWRAIPLADGQVFLSAAHPTLAISLLGPALSLPAFVILAGWHQGARATGPTGWLVHTSGLYAYGVYYLHPLVYELVAWSFIHGAGLGKTSVMFLVIAFPGVCVLSVWLVKAAARLPFARYLT